MNPVLFLVLLLSLPSTALGEEILAGLSQNRVSITATFDGSEILVFGAVKRDDPLPEEGGSLQVVVAVAGPSNPVTVRRKEKRYGIWVNTDSAELESAPSFYAVATTGRFRDVLHASEDQHHKVSIEHAVRSGGAETEPADASSFVDALIRIRRRERLYLEQPYTIILEEQTLFRTNVALPANLTEGNYTARVFLTRDGRVVDWLEKVIFVQKVGLERFIFNLAHERPLIYGVLSLFIAVFAGWLASTLFRALRR